MNSPQPSPSAWSRQEVLSLLQLVTAIVTALLGCIWRLSTERSKRAFF